MDIKEKHEKMLYPSVRVRTGTAGGSGTVLYSKPVPGSDDEYETYVLTNNHVIESNIKVGKKWSALVKREVMQDTLTPVDVEFFQWDYGSWDGGHSANKANIQCYDKEMDLGLVKLETPRKVEFIAQLFPQDEYKKRLRIFQEVCAVGAGMGHPPLATFGILNGFNDVIENYPYLFSSAPTIFGNSGGALYLAETGELIGVPSRITVAGGLFGGGDAITHLSYSIPIWSIYKFLKEQMFSFIYDDSTTSAECEEKRKSKREQDQRKLAVDMSREG